MAKRGESGISRVLGILKPVGISSHDVVNIVRRVFNERRVGHMGTLDPLASGVMEVAVGPATRLNPYLVDHDKSYAMQIVFGSATATDDAEGETIQQLPVPSELYDERFARATIAQMVGKHTQLPPLYSAIKVDGKKAYEEARAGRVIDLAPRSFEIYEAHFVSLAEEHGVLVWNTIFSVSKGTYMRSIARDLGKSLHTCAHVGNLERLSLGLLNRADCVTLEELEANPASATVDPLLLLGLRWAFVDEDSAVANGGTYRVDEIILNDPVHTDPFVSCCCTPAVHPSSAPIKDGENIALVCHRLLKAIYTFDQEKQRYKAVCVFSQGVERDSNF